MGMGAHLQRFLKESGRPKVGTPETPGLRFVLTPPFFSPLAPPSLLFLFFFSFLFIVSSFLFGSSLMLGLGLLKSPSQPIPLENPFRMRSALRPQWLSFGWVLPGATTGRFGFLSLLALVATNAQERRVDRVCLFLFLVGSSLMVGLGLLKSPTQPIAKELKGSYSRVLK
jgi:hypothetical protein